MLRMKGIEATPSMKAPMLAITFQMANSGS